MAIESEDEAARCAVTFPKSLLNAKGPRRGEQRVVSVQPFSGDAETERRGNR